MSSADSNNSEDASRNDLDQKRDAAAQPDKRADDDKASQKLMADKQVDDADFIPKFSAVRSKQHEGEKEQWTQGSFAQGTFEAPKPEAAPPSNVEMQEFGFHKDVIEQPALFQASVSPNVPSAQEQYQAHLKQMQAAGSEPQVQAKKEFEPNSAPSQAIASPEARRPDSTVSNSQIQITKQNQPSPQSNPTASQNNLPMQDQARLPIDELPDDATELFESANEKQQRVEAIRNSLYWIVEEAQIVRHGKFNSYDPNSEVADDNGNSNAFEMYDPDSLDYAPTVRIQDATVAGAMLESRIENQPLKSDEALAKPALSVPSEQVDRRAPTLPSPTRNESSEKLDERRTTYEGKKYGIAELPSKKEQLKKAVISIGSVILLCVACVVITYDTIVVKKPPETKPGTDSSPPGKTEKTEAQKGELDKPTTKISSVKDELKKAFALEQKKNYLGALEHFDLVLEDPANKSNAKALHGRGRVLTKLQRYERALEDLEAASDIDKGNELILIDLAAVKYLLADYSGAAREYERILSAHQGDVDALYGRGISYAALGKNDEAIADFENVVKLKPGYDKAYRQMCTTFLAINQPDKAEAAITVAMKACNPDADLYFSRGLARYQMGRKEEAIEDYDEAISESPKRKEYYNDRGYVLMELGRTDDAKKDFRQALEIDPHYKLAIDNLARIDKLRRKRSK